MSDIKLIISIKDIIRSLYIDSSNSNDLPSFISKLGLTITELYFESEKIVAHDELKKSYMVTRKVLDEYFGVNSNENSRLDWFIRKNYE